MASARLLLPVLLVAALSVAFLCEAATVKPPQQECYPYGKTKIGGCNEYKGFTPDPNWIGKAGLEGCQEVCREKGFIDGCCTSPGDEDCYCTLARSPEAPAPAPASQPAEEKAS